MISKDLVRPHRGKPETVLQLIPDWRSVTAADPMRNNSYMIQAKGDDEMRGKRECTMSNEDGQRRRDGRTYESDSSDNEMRQDSKQPVKRFDEESDKEVN
jgi:hypothetical protein